MNGYDFTDLSIKWQGQSVIEIFFRSGRVTHFTNSALVYPGGSVPKTFRTLLCDGCDTRSKIPVAGDLKVEPANSLTPNH